MKTKLKIFKKRFISVFMAVILFLGCFGYALGQSETAQAAISSPMRISKDGSIVWGTTSHANPNSGKRFHTMNYILMEPETSKCGDEERKKQFEQKKTVTILVSVSKESKQKKSKRKKKKKKYKK